MTSQTAARRERKQTPEGALFAKRLAEAFDANGIPFRGRPGWIADALGVTPGSGQQTLAGLSVPTVDKTRVLARRLNVSHGWLHTGDGTPQGHRAPPAPASACKPHVLMLVAADQAPPGAIAIGHSALLPFEDHLSAMSAAGLAHQLEEEDPRQTPAERRRRPSEWASDAMKLLADALAESNNRETARAAVQLSGAERAIRCWRKALSDGAA